jgi:hypothetical protein
MNVHGRSWSAGVRTVFVQSLLEGGREQTEAEQYMALVQPPDRSSILPTFVLSMDFGAMDFDAMEAFYAQQNLPRLPYCVTFRVLIIGRANAGKTSILQRVCDTTESPVIYRRDRSGTRKRVRSHF